MTTPPIAFKTVTLCDKSWVDPLVLAENSPSADYNFGNIYIWDKRYRQLIARVGDRMITKLRYEGKPAFVFPIGTGPLRPAVDLLRDFAAWRGYPLIIRGITDVHCEQLEREYPGCFTYTLEENNLDYIYRAEKLATYAGKSLHGKKNHCNRFEAEHDWQFLPLTRDLIPGCMDMLDVWTTSTTPSSAPLPPLSAWAWREACCRRKGRSWASPWGRCARTTPLTCILKRPRST